MVSWSPEGSCWAYSEFMVEEHELRKEKIQEDYNDKYWDQRYTVVQRQIPSFLQKMAGKVLSTGEPPVRAPRGAFPAWRLSCLTSVARDAVTLCPDPEGLSPRSLFLTASFLELCYH